MHFLLLLAKYLAELLNQALNGVPYYTYLLKWTTLQLYLPCSQTSYGSL